MQNRDLWLRLAVAAVLVLGVCACGGGEEAETPEPTATPEPIPDPPEEQDIDIEPGSVTMGDVLTGTLSANDQLPPQAFGAISNFKLEAVLANTVDLVSIKLKKDANNYIEISQSGGNVVWTRYAPERGQNTGTAITAYDPTAQSNNCYLMSSNLKDFFNSGVSLEFVYKDSNGNNKGGTGSLAKSGNKTPKIDFELSLADGNPCAPSPATES